MADSLPSQPLVWIDCEMTGLNPDTEVILEIYCFITDGQLNLVKSPADARKKDKNEIDDEDRHRLQPDEDAGWGAILHVDKARLDQMDEWCTDHHGRSGLTKAVLASTTTHEEAADGLLAYIQKYIPNKGVGLLAGSSVHADKAFLRQAPYDRVMNHLHYRILDVSTIKEAVKRWQPLAPEPEEVASGTLNGAPVKKMGNKKSSGPRTKESKHRARDDILDSIAEARYYKKLLFDDPAEEATGRANQ
ncbi:Phosphatidylinositol 3,4,5-trisphosphate-dependent Rac exchanger 2 protein [Sporothrix bragantina]|uniref:Phosphatidylinositol 3,4,5-trisphosphate-dependent Rac exchanger 2 protein n=1 Tax=Sporothrix bragantina TaxID=671064 RepID=A0ABP0BB28_9PEZI